MHVPDGMTCAARRSLARAHSILGIRWTVTHAERHPQLRRVGDLGRETRTFTEADVLAFTRLTHDDNPLHDDAAFAASQRFGGRVVHGMLYASMFSALIGQRSPGAVYVSQTLNFRRPVHLGDTVTAEVEVERVGRAGRVLDFATRCFNQRSEVVLSGEARVLMPARHGAGSH